MEKLLFFSLVTTGLSVFYDYATRSDGVLYWWWRLIEKLRDTWLDPLFSVLGGCIFCNNPWLLVLIWYCFTAHVPIQTHLDFLSVVAINHLLLRVWYRYVDNEF